MQKYLPFIVYYGSALLLFTLNYIVYEHLDRSLMSGHQALLMYNISDLYLLRFLRYILGFKLKNKNDKIF